MNIVIQRGLGGFIGMYFDHTHKAVAHAVAIRFGVGVISIYIDGDTRRRKPMTKNQDDYTVRELYALAEEVIGLIEL